MKKEIPRNSQTPEAIAHGLALQSLELERRECTRQERFEVFKDWLWTVDPNSDYKEKKERKLRRTFAELDRKKNPTSNR